MANIIEAVNDEHLFRPIFKDLSTWSNWLTCLKTIFAIPFENSEELAIYQAHTGRKNPPEKPFSEIFLVIGRRGGKSRIASVVATFLACLRSYAEVLAPGEKGIVLLVSNDRRQSRVTFRYVMGIFNTVPILKGLIERETAEAIDLSNGTSIEIHTASFRGLRGYSVICLIGDEVAYWRSEESQNPDYEIINAARPGMSNIPGSLLLCISSPYAKRGALWDAYKKFYGIEDSRTLVWVADTKTMNPTISNEIIQAAYEADPAMAAAEYGACFRSDLETFVNREIVEACVMPELRELPPLSEFSYSAFCDPSGGSQDSMTLAVAHSENGKVVLDALRERRPPFSPEEVVSEFCQTLKTYKISSMGGDRYAGEWPREQFRKHGIEYKVSEKVKSDIYRDFLPLLNSRRVQLLDDKKLITQLCTLERKTGRGKDSIDHSVGSHDDIANSAAGALLFADEGDAQPGFFFAGGAKARLSKFYRGD